MKEITISTQYDGRKRKGKTKACINCERDFWVPLHRYDLRQYCSRECASAHRHLRSTTEVECAQCGSKFRKLTSRLRHSKSGMFFCDKDCKNKAQRIGGVTAIMPPHYGNGICENATKQELLDSLGAPHYRKTISRHARDLYMRELKNDACELCGYDFYGEVCHIVPVSEFGGDRQVTEINTIANLIYLCPNHHKELDYGKLSRDDMLEITFGRLV